MDTENLIIRTISALLAAAGLLISLYMASLAGGEWFARYQLSGAGARGYGASVCASISGCRTVVIESRFSWREARRYVVYQLDGLGIDPSYANSQIEQLANRQAGVLGWTVRTPFTVSVGNVSGPLRKVGS